jgi:glutathione S-transferase
MNAINQLLKVATHNITRTDGKMSYERITETLIKLADTIMASDTSEETWWLGDDYSLPDVLVGAYWHYTEWHGGQWSQGYSALSAIGQVFDPGMNCLDDDNYSEMDIYSALNDMAQEANQ